MVERYRRQTLAQWMEANILLPDVVAEPGPITLAPHMRAIADAIGDPAIERVTVLKSARVGFTTLLTGAIAYHVVRDPCPILALLPTQDDCRDYVVSELERIFYISPVLQGRLMRSAAGRDRLVLNRNTLTHRLFARGDLKVVAGKAPRNLRRHTARILMVDESDAIEASAEGDPITLAERRTLSFANRKIITGGTPLNEATSPVTRLYRQSDQRIYEVPCPHCGAFHEIEWSHIEWPDGHPHAAAWRCPSCHALVSATNKKNMVERGCWRATAGSPTAHAGFRINALVSLLPNASWGNLAAEYERAKTDEMTLRVFVNTILGQPWRADEGDELDDTALAARREEFSLDAIPADVLALTCGIDVQGDRLEASILGHARDGTIYVLDHSVLWGAPADDDLWAECDKLLRRRFPHPHGGALGIDAAAIDAGDGGVYDIVLKFCQPRLARRTLAVKGSSGYARPAIQRAKLKKGAPLFIVGVDALKAQLFAKLSRGRAIRFSHRLSGEYFEQLTGERRVTRIARGKPVMRFERVPGIKAVEALDCMVYGMAAKAALNLSAAAFSQREDELRMPVPPKPPPAVVRSQWMSRP
jgi:phage terminase large subunit GpA-like protein